MAETSTTPPITPTTTTTTTKLTTTRPKFYKLKQEFSDYQFLCIEHQDQSINYFDYYMEFTPTILKRIFTIGFLLNKLLIIILIYCVFYNTIWWYKNSSSNSLAINYQIIDSKLFFILIYINFHEFLINNLLLRQLIFHFIKSFHLISTLKLKLILNYVEILLKFIITCFNFLYLVYYAQFTVKFSLFFLLPHFIYLIYYGFNYEIKFLNYVLLTNNFLPSTYSTGTIKNGKVLHGGDENNKKGEEREEGEGNESILRKFYELIKTIPQTSHIQIQKNYLFQNNNTNITCLTTAAPIMNITTSTTTQQQQQSNSSSSLITPISPTLSSSLTLLSTVRHSCIKDAISLREETELFSKLFNSRLKEICLRTFEIIFYNLIIPRLCVPDFINIRNFEFYSYVFIIIINTFVSYWLYYIPISFIMSLNRNAEHLGEWEECEKQQQQQQEKKDDTNSSSNDDLYCWFNTKFYFKGDLITYFGKYYRVKSKFCISIPTYKLHKTFYKYFHDPFFIVTFLAILKLACVILLGLVTYYEAKWYNIAVNMLYVIFNFHVLYIITRDWIVLYVKKFAKLHDE